MNMKLLFRMKDPNENLENLFEPRGTYYACKIERNQLDNSFKSIVPLDSSANTELIGTVTMDRLMEMKRRETLMTQCVTLEHPKQKRITSRRMSLTPVIISFINLSYCFAFSFSFPENVKLCWNVVQQEILKQVAILYL
ncbi:hypothetical protein chiPu_0000551 [Chiloscyllium punctatum]|uniref:Uncharacterized protein n=1 Tax=Chiloscyllium punctatum TaxID=137246 RepID=A0A401RVL9_CHIPU|nr:hypothetical protein [Chiloscyllium punctatum]